MSEAWRRFLARSLPASRYLPEFHRQYPGIRIELMEDHSDKLALALMNGKLDIAVMNLPHTLDYRKLTSDIIFVRTNLLASATRHPYIRTLLDAARISDGYPIAPAKTLLQLPLIKTKPGQNLTHEINHILGKHHIEPEILLETGNLTTAINLVATGIACTLVPEEGAKSAIILETLLTSPLIFLTCPGPWPPYIKGCLSYSSGPIIRRVPKSVFMPDSLMKDRHPLTRPPSYQPAPRWPQARQRSQAWRPPEYIWSS